MKSVIELTHRLVPARGTEDDNWLSAPLGQMEATVPTPPPAGNGGSPVTVIRPPKRHVAWRDHGDPDDNIEFHILSELGRGGMGVVFEAHQSSVGRLIALKMLKPDFTDRDLAIASFVHEAAVTGDLEHPNIVPIYDMGSNEAGQPFYAMKRIRGTHWSDVVDSRSLEENIEILIEVCDAIAYAHSRGVIHRDLKPDNVMLGDFGEVLVMDWGLAVALTPEAKGLHVTQSTVGGTPAYMAPELAEGKPSAIGRHSDIYLLGGILYRAVAGTPPHWAKTVKDCIIAARNNDIVPPVRNSRCELLDVALKAMSTNPEDRYKCVRDFQQALREFAKHGESRSFAARASEMADRARQTNDYGLYNMALFGFEEALRTWPHNHSARREMDRARLDLANLAMDRGELELAETVLAAGGMTDSEAGKRLIALRKERACVEYEQEQLRAEAEKWSMAFLVSPDPVLMARVPDGVIVEANDAFHEVFQYTREDIREKSLVQLGLWIRNEDRATMIEALKTEGVSYNVETVFRRRDGSEVPVLISARRMKVGTSEVVVSNIRDITSIKEAQAAIERDHQRMLYVQEQAGLGVWTFCPQSGKVEWSEQAYRIAGRDPALGPPTFEEYRDSIHPEDRPFLLNAIEQALKDGKPYSLIARHRRADGSYAKVLAAGTANIVRGRVVELFGSVMDVSASESTEQEFRKRIADLEAQLAAARAASTGKPA